MVMMMMMMMDDDASDDDTDHDDDEFCIIKLNFVNQSLVNMASFAYDKHNGAAS